MSIFQTFAVSFAVLLVAACLLIGVVWFCSMWFGMRNKAESQMRNVMGDQFQGHGTLTTCWHGLQAFCLCVAGVLALIAIGLWSLVAAPVYWAWYRVRGKPLPSPNYGIHDDVA